MALVPLVGAEKPSVMEVAMVKLLLKFSAGVKVTAASSALTPAIAPLAVHTPPTKVEVTPPEDPVDSVPAAGLDSVKVAVMLSPSASATTMSVRGCAPASSVKESAALRLLAVGGWLVEKVLTPVTAAAMPSDTDVAIENGVVKPPVGT